MIPDMREASKEKQRTEQRQGMFACKFGGGFVYGEEAAQVRRKCSLILEEMAKGRQLEIGPTICHLHKSEHSYDMIPREYADRLRECGQIVWDGESVRERSGIYGALSVR